MRIFSNSKHPAAQEVVSSCVDVMPFPELTFLIQTFDKNGHVPEVLCMGDSVWERLSRDDVDQRNIGQMLQDDLRTTLDVGLISHSAYNLQIFLNFIKALAKMKNRPKYMVLPINLRSFSPQWFLNPLWQFEHEKKVLEEYFANPAMKIPVLEQVIESPSLYNSFDATPVDYQFSDYKTIHEFRTLIASVPIFEEEVFFRLRQIFIFHYMHPLVDTHPLLKYLDEALRILADMKIKTFVYITPINYQAGVRFCGEDFSFRVALNTAVVQEVVTRHRENGMVGYVDYGTLLGSEYFFNLDNATEHLNENGRKILAEHLEKQLIYLMDTRKGEQ